MKGVAGLAAGRSKAGVDRSSDYGGRRGSLATLARGVAAARPLARRAVLVARPGLRPCAPAGFLD